MPIASSVTTTTRLPTAQPSDACELVGSKWKNHPLAMEVMLGIYSYLEKKCKAKS